MVDIILYGNITIDTILDNDTVYTSIGAVGNVWNALIQLDPTKVIHIEPIEYGQALIYIDRISGLKVSRPNLQLRYREPAILKAKWHHISYINRIRELGFVSTIQDSIISADIAGDVDFSFNSLSYIDYLFVAEEESKNLPLFLDHVKKAVIVHNKTGSICYVKNAEVLRHQTTEIHNINVLGAGDYFASAFIVNMMNGNDIDTALDKSHISTSNYLQNHE